MVTELKGELPPITLRPYQEFLVNECLTTIMNSLVVLPTGAGKTMIAFEVMRRMAQPNKTVVFLCPTVALVSQQRNAYYAMESNRNVLFSTPGAFLNTLQTTQSFESYSLIVVDEFHHATKNHPLMRILQLYRKDYLKPKILGLSASPVNYCVSAANVRKELLKMCYRFEAFIHTIPLLTQSDLYQNLSLTVPMPEIRLVLVSDWTIETLFHAVISNLIVANLDWRGIILVRTCAEANALAIRIQQADTKFKVGVLLGIGRELNENQTSTPAQQMRVLSDFKTGKYNLLIATSVAEEGLDIQLCSVVMRINENKITPVSLVQSKGRARFATSVYFVVFRNREKLLSFKESIDIEKIITKNTELLSIQCKEVPNWPDLFSHIPEFDWENDVDDSIDVNAKQRLNEFCQKYRLPYAQFNTSNTEDLSSAWQCIATIESPLIGSLVSVGVESFTKKVTEWDAAKKLLQQLKLLDFHLQFDAMELTDDKTDYISRLYQVTAKRKISIDFSFTGYGTDWDCSLMISPPNDAIVEVLGYQSKIKAKQAVCKKALESYFSQLQI